MAQIIQFITNHWKLITAVSIAFASIVTCVLQIIQLRNEIKKSKEMERKSLLDELDIQIKKQQQQALQDVIHKPTRQEIIEYTRPYLKMKDHPQMLKIDDKPTSPLLVNLFIARSKVGYILAFIIKLLAYIPIRSINIVRKALRFTTV